MIRLFYIFIFSFSYFSINAQLDHYWGEVYNPESALLSGAVVSGNAETGAAYYNPASISFMKNSAFSFNVNLISYQNFSFENIVAEQQTVSKSQLVLKPRFFAIVKQPKDSTKPVIEILYLNRNQFKIDLEGNFQGETDVLALPAGEELYQGTYKYYLDYNEQLYGLACAKKMSNSFSLGITNFLVMKNFNTKRNLNTHASPQSEIVQDVNGDTIPYYIANHIQDESISFFNYRWLIKIGANYQKKKWGIGLTATLPSINIVGRGTVTRTFQQSNIELPTPSDNAKTLNASDYQKKLPTNYKDPWSLAIGLHYKTRKSLYTFTAEYFGKIPPYKAIKAEENPNSVSSEVYNSLTEKDFLSVYHGANQVLNVGFGHKREIKENLLMYLGFRTDFSNSKSGLPRTSQYFFNQNNIISYNLYHFTLGSSLKVGKSELLLGVQYSRGGKQGAQQLANFSNPKEYNYDNNIPLQNTLNNDMSFRYNEISILAGITYSFISNLTSGKK